VLDNPPLNFTGNGYGNVVATDGVDFLVAFQEGNHVVGTFVPASGAYNPVNRFTIATSSSGSANPAIASDGRDFLVGYSTSEDPLGGVYAALVHRDAGVEAPIVISDVPDEVDIGPTLTALGPGDWRVAWSVFDPSPQVSAVRLRVQELITNGSVDGGGPVVPDDGGIVLDGGLVAPRFLSTSNGFGFCGAPYVYGSGHRPEVLGDGPLHFTVTAGPGEMLPPGLAIDASTGEFHWVPSAGDVGVHHFTLTVMGPGGTASQDITVEIDCAQMLPLKTSCGCGAGPGAGLLILLVFWRPRRRARDYG
jgi:hypothetical protein